LLNVFFTFQEYISQCSEHSFFVLEKTVWYEILSHRCTRSAVLHWRERLTVAKISERL